MVGLELGDAAWGRVGGGFFCLWGVVRPGVWGKLWKGINEIRKHGPGGLCNNKTPLMTILVVFQSLGDMCVR